MFDLSALFSSKARGMVLRTLCHQGAPLPLRHIAYLSHAPLYSVQRVLGSLVRERMVIGKRQGKYRLFALNKNHASFPLLVQLIDLEMRHQLAFSSSSNNLHQKAKSLLNFVSSAQRLMGEARSWT